MPFRLVTFGELSLCAPDNGRKVAVPKKALALMAVLASAGDRAVAREKVASLLWPDAEDSGRGALKQTIYELRQTLGNHSVIVGTAELALDPSEITSDVSEMEAAYAAEQWARVVELYAGPFLDRFHVRSSVDFDHWMDARRDRCKELVRHALEKLAVNAAASGDSSAAVAHWRRLAADDPFSSRMTLGLINALASAGDVAGALTHYRVHEQLLRDELGAEPDPALTAAVERLRNGNARALTGRDAERRGLAITERAGSVSGLAEPAPASPTHSALPPIERQNIYRSRSVWLVIVVTLLTAGALGATWRARPPAHVLASVSLPANSASRVGVDAHLNQIYVDGGASFDHLLTVIDGDTYESRRLPHGSGVTVDPLTGWYWTGDYGGKFVMIRNGRTHQEIGRVALPGCPHHVAIDAQRAWIAQQCDDHISVIDKRTRAVIRHIRMPTLSRAEVGGAKGMGEIVVNRATGMVYFWKDMIPHRLDPQSWEIREMGGVDGPVFAINEPGNRLYARLDNGLQVIDGATDRVVAHVKLPATPARVAVGFGGRRVYVASPAGLTALDGPSHRVLWTMSFPGGFSPSGVVADDARGRVYVLGRDAAGAHHLKILRLRD